ncbi:MAG: hypothetical protein DMG19_03020 [Acidobacteria bacterium]|nr:MAG: hypothetical protein DMG19_03020 [Acidobacteriota bacterium]
MTDHPIWPLIRRSCAAHEQGSGRMHRIAAKRPNDTCSKQDAFSCEEKGIVRARARAVTKK